MDFTCEVSKAYNLSPFEVMKQDKDEVIMLINYFIEKGQNVSDVPEVNKKGNKAERIRVNDKTATGGWY